jgi:hypothetical protein
MTPESEPSFGALVKVLVPEKVFESPRRVVDATVIDEPRETLVPLIVMDEFVRPALERVPVMFGVPKVKVPPVFVMVWEMVRPLKVVADEVAKVIAPVCAEPND